MSSVTLLDHFYVVLLLIVFWFAITKTQPQLKNQVFTTKDKIATYFAQSIFLYVIAILAIALWYFAGRPLADLGFRWPNPDNWIIYGAATLMFLVWFFVEFARIYFDESKLQKTKKRWKTLTPFMPSKKKEMPHAIHMSFAAGTSEEVVFRGFFIPYFAFLLGRTNIWEIENPLLQWPVIAAILIPAVIFSVAHLYQGWMMVGKIGGLAIAFGIIFVASGSLLIIAMLHFLIDVFACLISPYLLEENDAEPVEPALMTE